MNHALLQSINSPADTRRLSRTELKQLAIELRDFVGYCLNQRAEPIVSLNDGHRIQHAGRTLNGRQRRAQFVRERVVEGVS